MTGFSRLPDGRVLCCLQISNDCEGYVTEATAFEDAEGKWDICKPCAQHEKDHV